MNTKENRKALITATLCLLVICAVVTLAVAGTRSVFQKRIDEQEWKTTQDEMSKLLKADEYKEIKVSGKNNQGYEASDSSGDVKGYLFITAAYGYGGDVSVMTAISDGKVKGISVLDSSSETPGLGQNASEKSFTNQFEGLSSAPVVTKSKATSDDQIEAMTGATRTTNAVSDSVAAALKLYDSVAK